MSIAPARVCPLCGVQDDLEPPVRLPNGGWQFACTAHTPAHVFEVSPEARVVAYASGLAGELGLHEDLPRCVIQGEPWVEYGIVEYRYGIAHPVEYRRLVDTYGHRSAARTGRYSASVFLASTLGRLARAGLLVLSFGPGTGYWSYDSEISYWAAPPGPVDGERQTWEQFARAENLDPQKWPLAQS